MRFSTKKVWCTMYLHQLNKLLTTLFKCQFWKDWGRQWQGGWSLHHVNARSHTSIFVQRWLAIKNMSSPPETSRLTGFRTIWSLPLPRSKWASKDLTPWKTSNPTRWLNFGRYQNKILWYLPFHRCFQQWQERWTKCVCSEGAYFHGD